MVEARYSIGIDLGTSNSALAYIDLHAIDARSVVLPIGQLSSLDSIGQKNTLASCLYALTESERERCPESFQYFIEAKNLAGVVGQAALERTADSPSRVIQSAKSWLCHDGVNRHDPLLPWGSESVEAERRLSPVEASAAYLKHLKDEWNRRIAAADSSLSFEHQHISITVPASFDEVSQHLTLEAAALAGYPEGVRLLEEPQAAFYHWLENNADSIDWVSYFPDADEITPTVLVCDIGGGTTDFSFFDLELGSDSAEPTITRTAVSDHLLLGGDNIDLAIAHLLEERLAGATGKLSASEWTQLVHQARIIKEHVLTSAGTPDAPDVFPVSIVGSSSSMFASARSAELSRSELTQLLLEGFFPQCDPAAKPEKRQTGLTEWGLPFVSDSRVTHHLAGFLGRRKVSAVLFTGGTLSAKFLQQRLLDLISSWQAFEPRQLENPDMMLAVAEGAAYSGGLSSRPERKIRGGYSHSVYLEVEDSEDEDRKQLICILPQGTEEGTVLTLENLRFSLRVDQMVRFQLYYSNYRHADELEQVVELDLQQCQKGAGR
jgi:molecular chaperone DnaK (HSP70)